MMRYIMAGVIIVCIFLVLLPTIMSGGRKLRKYFQQANKTLEGGSSSAEKPNLKVSKNPNIKTAKSKRTKKSTVKKRK